MNRLLTIAAAGSLLFAVGCTTSAGSHMGLFSASAPVVAIMYDDLFVGQAVGYLDHTGTLDLHSVLDPQKRCVGESRYTGSKTGVAHLRCNDGAEAQASFNALGPLSGYGYGRLGGRPVSFTYGLTAEEAAQYLTLPVGKRIVKTPSGPALVDM